MEGRAGVFADGIGTERIATCRDAQTTATMATGGVIRKRALAPVNQTGQETTAAFLLATRNVNMSVSATQSHKYVLRFCDA